MRQFNNLAAHSDFRPPSRRQIGQSGRFSRYILATLLALIATTSLAHAGWSTVTCAGEEPMCCWVEDGVESNCHEGACHTLQGNSDNEELEEVERRRGASSDENYRVDEADYKAESRDESEGKSRRKLMEVSSVDGLPFCIDLRTMRAMDGLCPDADAIRDLRRPDPYDEEAGDEEADDEDPVDAEGDPIIDAPDEDPDDGGRNDTDEAGDQDAEAATDEDDPRSRPVARRRSRD